MRSCRRAFCLALPLVLVADPPAAELRLDPEPGKVVAKRLEQRLQLDLDEFRVFMNDAEVPAEFLPQLEVESESRAWAQVVDEYLACADGRPLRLRRSYEELGASELESAWMNGEPLGGEQPLEGRAEVEGCVVLFEEGGARRSLERGSCAPDALEQLAVELDLLALLRGAEDGADSWELDAKALDLLELPGGLGITLEERPDGEPRADAAQLRDHLEGTWRVERAGQRDVEGRPMAALELEGRLRTHARRATDLAVVPVVDGDATERTELRLDARGELLWDLEHRLLHHAQVFAQVEMDVVVTRDPEGIEGEPTYEHTLAFVGELEFSLSSEVRP